MIRQIKQKQWLENKNKVLYFRNKLTFSPLHCIIEGNYLEQHKEAAGVIYITVIANVKF